VVVVSVRSSPMKKILIALGIITVAALNGPWLIEGASSNCASIEQRREGKAAVAEGRPNAMSLSDGRTAAMVARRDYPSLPAPVTCAMAYWLGVNLLNRWSVDRPRRQEARRAGRGYAFQKTPPCFRCVDRV
jgi:hypothetical protein